MKDLASLQAFMEDRRIGGWLLYDFRGSNPVLARALRGKRWTTRRAALLIPAKGDPVLLAHRIDEHQFADAGIACETYLTWQEYRAWLARALAAVGGSARVAMEYAPGGTLPAVSIVDGGTIELVRSMGVEVVSSADLVQFRVARWSPEARRAHDEASQLVGRIKDEAFDLIRERIAADRVVTEFDVQRFILSRFEQEGLETAEAPIVAVNANSGDPHYAPTEALHMPISRGDWVLIDLWARRPGDENVYADITWVGFVGERVPRRHQEIFEVVRAARDVVVERAAAAWQRSEPMLGWQLDEASRGAIIAAGHERYIRHRTGHSLSPGPAVHGLGVNLDNLETHDTREVLPGIGFTVEPGVYLPEFGVRLEINVYMDPDSGPVVTSGVQRDVVILG